MNNVHVAPKYLRWLLELTGLPTAAGCEGRVIDWLRRWARRRRQVLVRQDGDGNLELKRRGQCSGRQAPIFFTAHMDHPAFVVVQGGHGKCLVAEFRGGVRTMYFASAKVLLHRGTRPPVRGTVCRPVADASRADSRHWEIHFARDVEADAGDVLTWDVGPPRVTGVRLRAPACDDLAGVAAAICAFDAICSRRTRARPDVRLLLTRAEEVGFLGAIAAAKARSLPTGARLITIENSKSFTDSPVGGGPIVRVGDRTSVFDPELTYHLGDMADKLARQNDSMRWQRRLMLGGTCEATAFGAYGFRAACLCLPLENYHNMNEATGRIAAEAISLADFSNLVRLLVAIGMGCREKNQSSLQTRLDSHFVRHRAILGDI